MTLYLLIILLGFAGGNIVRWAYRHVILQDEIDIDMRLSRRTAALVIGVTIGLVVSISVLSGTFVDATLGFVVGILLEERLEKFYLDHVPDI